MSRYPADRNPQSESRRWQVHGSLTPTRKSNWPLWVAILFGFAVVVVSSNPEMFW